MVPVSALWELLAVTSSATTTAHFHFVSANMDDITPPPRSQYQPLVSIMTSTMRPAGEDGKLRPGGARTSGVKTPRKVQWAADKGADSSTSTHDTKTL